MTRRAWVGGGEEVAVIRQCELAGVARATIYAQKAPPPMDERELLYSRLIDEEYTRHPFYGTRRMVIFLSKAGHRVNRNRDPLYCTDTPTSRDTSPTLALSGGNNLATALFLNASPYRAIFRPYRPQVQDHIEATTILTQGATQTV